MPNAIVEDLIRRVGKLEEQASDLSKKVAVLLSWHKVQVGLLSVILTACLAIAVEIAKVH